MLGSLQQESVRAMHRPASIPPASQTSFSSIVNFLFTPPEVGVGSDVDESPNSSGQSSHSALQVADKQGADARVSNGRIADAQTADAEIADTRIADAMIRSMLSSGKRASTAISSKAGHPGAPG